MFRNRLCFHDCRLDGVGSVNNTGLCRQPLLRDQSGWRELECLLQGNFWRDFQSGGKRFGRRRLELPAEQQRPPADLGADGLRDAILGAPDQGGCCRSIERYVVALLQAGANTSAAAGPEGSWRGQFERVLQGDLRRQFLGGGERFGCGRLELPAEQQRPPADLSAGGLRNAVFQSTNQGRGP